MWYCIRSSRTQGGCTALIRAAAGGHTDCVRVLIDANVDKEASDSVRHTIIFTSCFLFEHFHNLYHLKSFHLSSFLFSCSRPWYILGQTQNGRTALFVSAMKGHTDCVRLLAESGVDTEPKSEVRGLNDIVSLSGTNLIFGQWSPLWRICMQAVFCLPLIRHFVF